MGVVIKEAVQEVTLDDGDFHNLDFSFPIGSSIPKRVLAGQIAIAVRLTLAVGSDLDHFYCKVKELVDFDDDGTLVAAAEDVETLKDDFTFVDESTYVLPVTEPFGPADGIRVMVKYTNGTSESKELTVEARVITV